jgi:hypothetical protein
MPLTKTPIQQMINTQWPEIRNLDDFAESCACSKGNYRNTSCGVSRDSLTLQTTLIMVNISVFLTITNPFNTT